jgi:hypothetical protein
MSDAVNTPPNYSRFGHLLYHALPDHYRDRDDGTLAQYLDICGSLLDRINHALDTLHEDFLPGGADAMATAQSWTMPYTAKLYGAKLVCPDDEGRRQEVQHSIRWNKQKGTLRCIEEIIEALGVVECVIGEGRSKTISSVRIGQPRLPAAYFGQEEEDNTAALHPGNPVATPVIGRTMAPELAKTISPDVEKSTIAGRSVTWRTPKNHGVPQNANAFFDRSLRSLDFRPADIRGGQANPARIVLHIPPFIGFFQPGMDTITWDTDWRTSGHTSDLLSVTRTPQHQGRDLLEIRGRGGKPVYIKGRILTKTLDVVLENVVMQDSLEVRGGNLTMSRCAVSTVVVTSRHVETPYCTVNDSLVNSLQLARGTVRLEHVTLLEKIICDTLLASDSILTVSKVKRGDEKKISIDGYLRYAMIPKGFLEKPETADLQWDSATVGDQTPLFFTSQWGAPGFGAVVRGSSDFAEYGSENQGALGCYNHMFFSRRFAAIKRKIKDFLPFGMTAAVVEDPLLWDDGLFGLSND